MWSSEAVMWSKSPWCCLPHVYRMRGIHICADIWYYSMIVKISKNQVTPFRSNPFSPHSLVNIHFPDFHPLTGSLQVKMEQQKSHWLFNTSVWGDLRTVRNALQAIRTYTLKNKGASRCHGITFFWSIKNLYHLKNLSVSPNVLCGKRRLFKL